MTVGIAAISAQPKRLFLVADGKVSNNFVGHDDGAMKIRMLAPGAQWWCVFSAEDVDVFENIYRRIRSAITAIRHDDGYPVEDIVSVVEEAYREELEALTSRQTTQESAVKYGTQVDMAIAGFDRDGAAHLGYVNSFGCYRSWTAIGFCGIGVGGGAAWASLKLSEFRSTQDLGLKIYRLCEAKFLAEAYDGVGPTTTVVTVEDDGMYTILTSHDDVINNARQAWKAARATPAPPHLRYTLTGGFTIDKENRGVRYVIEDGLHLASMRLFRMVVELEAWHEASLIDDETWLQIESGRRMTDTLFPQINAALKEWDESTVRPAELDNLYRWYCEAVEKLAAIKPNYNNSPSSQRTE